MEHRKRIIPVVILILLALSGYYLYLTNRLPFVSTASVFVDSVSGFIEGEEISIAAEVGGRIEIVAVDEGESVTKGQELVRLDRATLDAQIAQAQAALATAQAQLAQVKAGARAEDIRQAEAALAQAVAQRDGAKRAFENASAVRDTPQELDVRIAVADAQLKAAKFQIEIAQANAITAKTRVDAVGGVDQVRVEGKALVNAWWAAEASLQAAQANYNGAQKTLELLNNMKAQPLTLNPQVDAAKAQYDSAVAAVSIAQARLDATKAGATKEQVNVADAAVKQAEAALGVLQVQSNKMTLKSPANGIVTRRVAHTGEIAAPNASLLTIANLETVKLTIYVPETQIGKIKIGDAVPIQVDSFPGKVFQGKVIFIASQAEFTPRNVQTKTERVNTVFAVKVQIPNPQMELKPGMPADAALK
ncbi:MAG: efflux RND transporter periplasmic adaptor subunit [Anaerolineales bacterium]|nr:efflux RND transporter periplasmic adaptor subunit [Anaerolineales bacterium]